LYVRQAILGYDGWTLASQSCLSVFFKNVSPEVNERTSFGYQATNEIIQNLAQEGLIERDTVEYIRLTQKGLDKCKENCR
jgi:hypothetical protein